MKPIFLLLTFSLTAFLGYAQVKSGITIELHDSSRNRPVTIAYWAPPDAGTADQQVGISAVDPTKHHIVLLSHGTGGNRFSLSWLASSLVEQGFFVVSVEHYGNSSESIIPAYFLRYWERPLDISFVLDYLEQSEFKDRLDFSRVGMIGFSFGGYTSIALAGAVMDTELLFSNMTDPKYEREIAIPELADLMQYVNEVDFSEAPDNLKDRRIAYFVALAPAWGLGFGSKEQFKAIDRPLLIIGAEADEIAPVATNAAHYHQLINTSKYILLEGDIGHYIFLPEGSTLQKEQSPVYFQDAENIDRSAVHQRVVDEVIGFITR